MLLRLFQIGIDADRLLEFYRGPALGDAQSRLVAQKYAGHSRVPALAGKDAVAGLAFFAGRCLDFNLGGSGAQLRGKIVGYAGADSHPAAVENPDADLAFAAQTDGSMPDAAYE